MNDRLVNLDCGLQVLFATDEDHLLMPNVEAIVHFDMAISLWSRRLLKGTRWLRDSIEDSD